MQAQVIHTWRSTSAAIRIKCRLGLRV